MQNQTSREERLLKERSRAIKEGKFTKEMGDTEMIFAFLSSNDSISSSEYPFD